MTIADAAAFLRGRFDESPAVGLVLGSGLGALADAFESPKAIPFTDVPGFGRTAVEGHKGMVVAGRLEGVPCIALQGRRHVYEGHAPADLAWPTRVLALLGVHTLIVTNAAGGINANFLPGDLMIIDDHINLLWTNPLIGPVHPGENRFPDMSEPYDRSLQQAAEDTALAQGIRTVRGVYCAVTGPSYETPAEIRMLRHFGADAVGMSTVPETLAARAAGVRVLGISLITNPAAGLSLVRLVHDDVVAAGARAATAFARLIRGVLAHLHTKTE